jgi:hypothetical protein
MDCCPNCNAKLDGTTGVSEESGDILPEPGCVTLCCQCLNLLKWNKDMKLIMASQKDWDDMPREAKMILEGFIKNVSKERAKR